MSEYREYRMGRPTTYHPKYCDEVIEHMREGKSLTSFAASLMTHRGVLYKWMDKYPDFRDACKTAQQLSQQWYEDFSHRAATGEIFDEKYQGKYDKYNPNMLQFLMSRRFKDYQQTTKQEVEIKDASKMEDQELAEYAQEAIKLLKEGDID